MTTYPLAPATRPQQFAFLRDAHHGPTVWERLCLSLARQAAHLPAVHSTAIGAAYATPKAHRIPTVDQLRRGMIGYFANFSDANTAEHIATFAGFVDREPSDDLDDTWWWTNDALRPGGVDLVRGSFFPREWGDPFLFGARSLNGYMLPGHADPVPAPPRPHLGRYLDDAITALRAAIRYHRREGHRRVVRDLTTELADLKALAEKYPRKG